MITRDHIAIDGTTTTAKNAVRFFWKILRLPIVAVLLLCEPILRIVCAAVMVFGVLTAVVLKASAIGPHFPVLGMLVFVAGFGVLLFIYHGLIALLLRGD
jgi:hypothetical protein